MDKYTERRHRESTAVEHHQAFLVCMVNFCLQAPYSFVCLCYNSLRTVVDPFHIIDDLVTRPVGVYVLLGLFASHIVAILFAFWLNDDYWYLFSFQSHLPWVALALAGLVVFLLRLTFRSRQSRSIERHLHIDDRFEANAQYCEMCNLVTPIRTKHCKVCGICSERFDHHCSLIGICVGRQNHRWFFLLLLADVAFLGLLNLMIGITWWTKTGGYWLPLVIFVLFGASIGPFGLLVFHAYMMVSNQTTWEWSRPDKIYYMKDLEEEILPFDLGCWRNITEFWFYMHKPSYFWSVSSEIYEAGYEPPPNCCNNKHYSCF